jgi:hypothetical protein
VSLLSEVKRSGTDRSYLSIVHSDQGFGTKRRWMLVAAMRLAAR